MWFSVQKLIALHILNFFKVSSVKTRPERKAKDCFYSLLLSRAKTSVKGK